MDLPISTKQAYAEVDSILEILDDSYQNKIPQEIRKIFKQEKDTDYINKSKLVKKQQLKEETLAILALLNLEYWCEDDNEKEKLIKIYKENDAKYEKKRRQKYNPENVFQIKHLNQKIQKQSDKKELVNQNIGKKDTMVRILQKSNYFKRFLAKIKKFFTK